MALGAGKYDEMTSVMREIARAKGIVVLVFDGNEGSGFSAQMAPELLVTLPAMLRQLADQIEADLPELRSKKGAAS